jgi:transposase-like protein
MERFAHGGHDVETFCATEGVSRASFYRWRRLLRDGPGGAGASQPIPAFLDLGALRPAPGTDTGALAAGRLELTLDLGGGLVLHLARG